MIDTSASGNFMLTRFIRKHGIATQEKKKGYELIAIDGLALLNVSKETVPLKIAIQQHYESMTFDVINTASHDVVLGMP